MTLPEFLVLAAIISGIAIIIHHQLKGPDQ